MISFDNNYNNQWAIIVVTLDGISYEYGPRPYYNCNISDVNGKITVTFDEYFTGQEIARQRIVSLYLIVCFS